MSKILHGVCDEVEWAITVDIAPAESPPMLRPYTVPDVDSGRNILLSYIQEMQDRKNFGISNDACSRWAKMIHSAIEGLRDRAKETGRSAKMNVIRAWLDNLQSNIRKQLDDSYYNNYCERPAVAPGVTAAEVPKPQT